ncbi:hypothetical protein FXW07_05815 [Methanosarcina sp. DH1]|uniref:hypothetical protein n=1 Tax=Methanosarcina sp. DH1 TaxID=2605695 RepID=UPI001E2B1964|nr:hypothetical protein [Methanosarcina sp. DH1]MCC4766145.1 hypothetical protein [Methanosarcina sp. DH1]
MPPGSNSSFHKLQFKFFCLSATVGAATVAPVYHKPLRRFITPIGFGDKVIRLKRFLGFSVKPFLKRVAVKPFLKKLVIMLMGFGDRGL